jgi:hypothetical protein
VAPCVVRPGHRLEVGPGRKGQVGAGQRMEGWSLGGGGGKGEGGGGSRCEGLGGAEGRGNGSPVVCAAASEFHLLVHVSGSVEVHSRSVSNSTTRGSNWDAPGFNSVGLEAHSDRLRHPSSGFHSLGLPSESGGGIQGGRERHAATGARSSGGSAGEAASACCIVETSLERPVHTGSAVNDASCDGVQLPQPASPRASPPRRPRRSPSQGGG